MKYLVLFSILCNFTTNVLAQEEEHADIRPSVAEGAIVTDGFIDPISETIPGLRVFGYDFGEDPEAPYFASDPGINAAAGSGLPGGSQLALEIPSSASFDLAANLTYWDGDDADTNTPGVQVNFGTVPGGEEFTLSLSGAGSVTVGNTTASQNGFNIQQVLASGAVHRHLSSVLDAPGTPADGIYLLPLRLTSSDLSIAPSQALFLVFNNGLLEAQHDDAIDYVTLNYAYTLGDMDGDGDRDNFDIEPFELALTNSAAYLAEYPELTSYRRRGDIDGDGDFDNFDIQPFEQLLTGSGPGGVAVPEPASFGLMLLGLLTSLVVRARGSSGRSASPRILPAD